MNIRQELMELMKKNGPMTRADFCEELCYEKYKYHNITVYKRGQTIVRYHSDIEQYHSRTTVYDNLIALEKQGKIEKFSENNGKHGRPNVFWRLIEA